MGNSAKALENPTCALFYYFKALGCTFPYLTPTGDCVAGSVIVSVSLGGESGLWEVMGPTQGHSVNEWWHQDPLAALAPDITLFNVSNYPSREDSSATETGAKRPWLLGKQMVFPGPWTTLFPRFKTHCDSLLDPPTISPPKQGKM